MKMSKDQDFDVSYAFFSGKRIEDIIVLSFKESLIHHGTDLDDKALLVDYLERVSKNDAIKVVLIIGAPEKIGREEYIEFYRQHLQLQSGLGQTGCAKLYNAVNQLILELVGFNKMVIHADSGKLISFYMNISLACDYRIIGDNSVFQNPYLDLGLVPKGGGAFFLSRILGPSKASKVLLSDKDISADEALRLGIVEQVVPSNELNEAALKTARDFAQKPLHSMLGIKRLLNCCTRDLENCLQCENELLFRIINEPEFREKLKEYK